MNKVIYIKFTPLTKKIYRDLCMESLISNGYSVEYWDVQDLFGIKMSKVECYVPTESLKISKISSYKDFEAAVAANSTALFLVLMACNYGQRRFFAILTKYHCRLGFWGPDVLPFEKHSVAKKMENFTFQKLWSKIGKKLMLTMFKVNILHPYDYVFSAGNKGFVSLALGITKPSFVKSEKVLDVNSADYDNFVYGKQERLVDEDYIVFIDQYYPFHPDGEILNQKRISADAYYAMVNHALDLVEKKFDLKVVIAAHPKALLYKQRNYYNGRAVLFGVSSSLIKYANLVIAHNSTAIDYAVMAHKPVVLLNSKYFMENKPEVYESIESFSNQLALPMLMMDSNIEDKIKNISMQIGEEQKDKQNNYLYEFCTSPDLKEPNEKLVVKYIDAIFQKE